MDIVIVAQYLRDIESFEGNNSRFIYLAKMLRDNQCDVEIITSNYHHSLKTHFKSVGELTGIKVTTIKEPGYPKNICLKRFLSHKVLAKNIGNYLKERKKPDVVYAAVPSLDVAEICADYCKANDVKFIIDIQDLWPEAFKMVFSIPVLSQLIYLPMKLKAEYVYRTADSIVAVSNTYVDRALKASKKCNKGYSIYLGTDLSEFDRLAAKSKYENKPHDEIWVVYIGTLGHSYDIPQVIDALDMLNSRKIHNVKFIVMGDGPLRFKYESYANQKRISIKFTGRLDYEEMVGILSVCDIAVNPIRKGSAGSIINKVGDYAAASLPVINTQQSNEYQNLLKKYSAGVNCNNCTPKKLADIIQKFILNEELRLQTGRNNREIAENYFDRKQSYSKIITVIEENLKN